MSDAEGKAEIEEGRALQVVSEYVAPIDFTGMKQLIDYTTQLPLIVRPATK